MGDDPILPVMSKIATPRRRQVVTEHLLQFGKGRARLFHSPQSELSHREHGGAFCLSIRKRVFEYSRSPLDGLLESSLAIVRERFRAQIKCVWDLAFSARHRGFSHDRYRGHIHS